MKALAILLAMTGTAAAQVVDIEVPQLVIEQDASAGPSADEALDLANIVQSAAKGVTTVQEAPAIVTVVTADEIRDRQFQDLRQIYDTVPGWYRSDFAFQNFHSPLVRGQIQAVQFLHDGVSLFDPFVNVPATSRMQPIELIKRVEMITGPGGVLWGSNSLLGILNVITKDADDVDGVELGAQLGDGRGDRMMARAYVMAGTDDLLDGKLELFGHGSVETFQGAEMKLPLLLYHGALPQPNSANVYGPLAATDQDRSVLVNLNAKVTYGDFQLRVSAPFSENYNPAGLSANPSRGANRNDHFDRYAVLEYRTRFADEKAGITARGYLQQFVRGFEPLQVLASSQAIPGGLEFATDLTSYRVGTAIDGDVELSREIRLLYGAEAFDDFKPDDNTPARIPSPANAASLPLLCPRIFDEEKGQIVAVPGCPLTFAFAADRAVLGAYVNPQYRPNKKLIFDLGGRVQVAPDALGLVGYPVKTTVGGAVVWNFIPNWHLKLNYTQGFRPPVFNNTTSNGEGVQIAGNPDLLVETSDAAQAEINARIWKGERRIRELSFRIDGSYTRINNLIQITSGNYRNSGERGIASAEFLGKLYIQGGHRLELGYTWLRADTSDKGRLRGLPEHWLSLGNVFALSSKVTATSTLKIVGASEDPNRIVEYRDARFGDMGTTMNDVTVGATDLVLDRLPPIAELSLGLAYVPTPKLAIRAAVYDALVSHAYQPDVFFDYEPHLEYLPNPYEGFRAYVSALYQY